MSDDTRTLLVVKISGPDPTESRLSPSRYRWEIRTPSGVYLRSGWTATARGAVRVTNRICRRYTRATTKES